MGLLNREVMMQIEQEDWKKRQDRKPKKAEEDITKVFNGIEEKYLKEGGRDNNLPSQGSIFFTNARGNRKKIE